MYALPELYTDSLSRAVWFPYGRAHIILQTNKQKNVAAAVVCKLKAASCFCHN